MKHFCRTLVAFLLFFFLNSATKKRKEFLKEKRRKSNKNLFSNQKKKVEKKNVKEIKSNLCKILLFHLPFVSYILLCVASRTFFFNFFTCFKTFAIPFSFLLLLLLMHLSMLHMVVVALDSTKIFKYYK